jgi:hypothetical protein
MLELERLGVRIVSGRVGRRGEDDDDDGGDGSDDDDDSGAGANGGSGGNMNQGMNKVKYEGMGGGDMMRMGGGGGVRIISYLSRIMDAISVLNRSLTNHTYLLLPNYYRWGTWGEWVTWAW